MKSEKNSREFLKVLLWSFASAVISASFFLAWLILEQVFSGEDIVHSRMWNYIIYSVIFSVVSTTIIFSFALRGFLHEREKIYRDLEAVNGKLRQLAITDGLTGIYNHRYFEMKLEGEWKRWERFHHPLACVILDLDDFKKLNDTCGHRAGDEVLRRVARSLKKELREVDIISRYGGEEFAIIFVEKPSHPRGLFLTMEKIRKKINEIESECGGKKISASFGGAFASPKKTDTLEKLISAADSAMYDAKKAGKNCSRVFGSPELK